MDIGIGLSETMLVLLLVLVFFGSKQLPSILRELGKITATLKSKANEVLSEIQEVGKPVENTFKEEVEKKAEIRKKQLAKRRALTEEEVRNRSEKVVRNLMDSDWWRNANAVMLYMSLPKEVRTDELVEEAFKLGKRVVIPYIKTAKNKMAHQSMLISEISSMDALVKGSYKIREPLEKDRKPFFKSDLGLVVCPGVAFDKSGGRLGFGKGFYDEFLREIRGSLPMVALAFDFQIIDDSLPFSYRDVPVDAVITETETLSITNG